MSRGTSSIEGAAVCVQGAGASDDYLRSLGFTWNVERGVKGGCR